MSQNSKWNCFGHSKLGDGIYLGFGICDLGFKTQCVKRSALSVIS